MSPAGCYTSPSSVLPYIPLQLFCCSLYKNVASDNYLAVYASDACFEPTGTAQMRQQVESGGEAYETSLCGLSTVIYI